MKYAEQLENLLKAEQTIIDIQSLMIDDKQFTIADSLDTAFKILHKDVFSKLLEVQQAEKKS